LVGSSAEKLLGLKIADFPWVLDDNDAPVDGDWPWQQAMQDAESRLGVLIKMSDPEEPGKSRTFMVNCSPVLADGGSAKGVLVSFDDITELEEKEVQLRQSMQLAEDANRAKSDFLANMSHEIRTPMNAILGFTEILKRGQQKTPEESAKYLNTIASSGEHLLNLINDILDLSKVEAGRMDMEIIDCQLHTVIKEVTKIMNIKAEQKGISMEFCPEGALPETIQSDSGRVRQMLTNLVGNAIKFTEQGGVKIVTRFEAGGEQPSIVVEVTDSGIGMTQEQADNVFNPFTQADNSISRRFGGTGLGLTISKNFVEALGGSIAVRSAPGEGSTFILDIPTGAIDGVPMLEPAALLEDNSEDLQNSGDTWQFPDSRILVVDDGVENRELLQVVLGDLGLQIDAAENGKIGLDMVLANDYSMVLMDVNMPVMDGLESVGKMREAGVEIPVVALTASAMKGTEEECINAGYSGYMAKPIVIDQLTAMLAKELGGKRVAAEAVQPAAQPAAQPVAVEASNPEPELTPVRSSLLDANPKFRPIVEKFVVRLGEQVLAFEKAWDAKDYKQLSDLAHWLKGSGGSVGFNQFSAVAAELEQQAKQCNEVHAAELITDIRSKYERIDITEATAAPTAAAPAAKAQPVNRAPVAALKSTLPTNNVRFCNIVLKFGERLEQQVAALREAIDAADYATVKDLAHWLKGSAGSVGFAAFTEPAANLEQAAKEQSQQAMQEHFAVIDDLRQRMVLPEAPADDSQAVG
ncbi:MAG: response regulator, partial [Pseudomonadales bacterium]|nr:response regulator [Pseudomonadales bacterium]